MSTVESATHRQEQPRFDVSCWVVQRPDRKQSGRKPPWHSASHSSALSSGAPEVVGGHQSKRADCHQNAWAYAQSQPPPRSQTQPVGSGGGVSHKRPSSKKHWGFTPVTSPYGPYTCGGGRVSLPRPTWVGLGQKLRYGKVRHLSSWRSSDVLSTHVETSRIRSLDSGDHPLRLWDPIQGWASFTNRCPLRKTIARHGGEASCTLGKSFTLHRVWEP